MKKCFIDFEYRGTKKKNFDLISCVYKLSDGDTVSHWLFKDNVRKEILRKELELLSHDYCFVAFNVEAEANCFMSLGIPFETAVTYKWVDLHLEWKMVLNHNHQFSTGKHIIGGEEITIPKFGGVKPSTSLVSCAYKLLNVKIDGEHKTKMRDIIIYGEDKDIQEYRNDILRYNSSDIIYLPSILNKLLTFYGKNKQFKVTGEELYLRGEYAVRTAQMLRIGTPINMEWTANLTENIPVLIEEIIQDINEQFPDIKPFNFIPKTGKWKMNQKDIRAWLTANGHTANWDRTDTGLISLSLDAWTSKFDYKHTYPRNNFPAQIVRYLKLKQSLNGFINKAGKESKTFWDYVDMEESVVRSYMNTYGAQSSRSQPGSTGFIFLKPAWQRSLVQPPKGKVIVGIDYSSEEFLLGALMSGDEDMIQAYASGDVYLSFGKQIGIIPKEGTTQSHKFERDLCKSTVLGLSYLMSKVGLSHKLTQDTGKYVSEDEAQDLVNLFYNAYPTFSQWRQDVISEYQASGFHKLHDGWIMFGDNDNVRSVGNMPIQGMGADIMRRAVKYAQDVGIDIIFTLHDAVYALVDLDNYQDEVHNLVVCMKDAFCHYFKSVKAKLIRMEGEVWSNELEPKEITVYSDTKIKVENIHIDERAIEEYKTYSKYFIENKNLNLL